MGHKDLRLGKIVYILVFYNISFSWLLSLDGFQYIFLVRDSRVTVKTIYSATTPHAFYQNFPNSDKNSDKNLNSDKNFDKNIDKKSRCHVVSRIRQRSVNSHLCSCFRYVEAGIFVCIYLRIMSCGPFVIIFSRIL